jgi:hypothetical protein
MRNAAQRLGTLPPAAGMKSLGGVIKLRPCCHTQEHTSYSSSRSVRGFGASDPDCERNHDEIHGIRPRVATVSARRVTLSYALPYAEGPPDCPEERS